jgi:hypothetical protein
MLHAGNQPPAHLWAVSAPFDMDVHPWISMQGEGLPTQGSAPKSKTQRPAKTAQLGIL